MTVSSLALAQTLTNQLSAQESSIAQIQQQLATGQVLNQPSDNPAAVTQVLALSSQASQLTSWQTNADTATSWLGTANNTANSVLESMQSAQSLLLQSLNQGAQDPTTYEALGDQLQGVVSNLLSLSNTQYEGRPIFAGTSAGLAYSADGAAYLADDGDLGQSSGSHFRNSPSGRCLCQRLSQRFDAKHGRRPDVPAVQSTDRCVGGVSRVRRPDRRRPRRAFPEHRWRLHMDAGIFDGDMARPDRRPTEAQPTSL